METGERSDGDNQNPLVISDLIWVSSTYRLAPRGEKKSMGQAVVSLDSPDIEILGCERNCFFVL